MLVYKKSESEWALPGYMLRHTSKDGEYERGVTTPRLMDFFKAGVAALEAEAKKATDNSDTAQSARLRERAKKRDQNEENSKIDKLLI